MFSDTGLGQGCPAAGSCLNLQENWMSGGCTAQAEGAPQAARGVHLICRGRPFAPSYGKKLKTIDFRKHVQAGEARGSASSQGGQGQTEKHHIAPPQRGPGRSLRRPRPESNPDLSSAG